MHTVALFQTGQTVKQYLESELPDFIFVEFKDAKNLQAALAEGGGDSLLDAIIVGSAVQDPIRTAQKMYFIDKNVSVILLSSPNYLVGLSKALQTSPLLGEEVSALIAMKRETFVAKVKAAAESTVTRRKYGKTIDNANLAINVQSKGGAYVSQYLDRIMEEAPIGIAMTDATGKVVAMNKQAATILKTSERDALGKTLLSFLKDSETDPLKEYITASLQEGNSMAPIVVTYEHDKKFLEITLSRFEQNVSETGFLVLLQDVTDRELAAAKEKERIRLVALNHSKDEFISLASHQLRTPATGVKQYLGMVLEGYFGDLTDKQRQMLEVAYESNERQLNIVSDLLKVARIDAGNVALRKENVDMNGMIESIVHDASPKFKAAEQQLVYSPPKDAITGYVDPTYMRMALENLLDNAHKYTPATKKIEVTLRRVNELVVIAIADQGVGIKTQDQSKLFRKFSRIDNILSVHVGGTGLGLYWTKKVIDFHGGKITVESKENVGTTFTVSIPLR